jgi:hypothetical protein
MQIQHLFLVMHFYHRASQRRPEGLRFVCPWKLSLENKKPRGDAGLKDTPRARAEAPSPAISGCLQKAEASAVAGGCCKGHVLPHRTGNPIAVASRCSWVRHSKTPAGASTGTRGWGQREGQCRGGSNPSRQPEHSSA